MYDFNNNNNNNCGRRLTADPTALSVDADLCQNSRSDANAIFHDLYSAPVCVTTADPVMLWASVVDAGRGLSVA